MDAAGTQIDGDGDGSPGGLGVLSFSTITATPVSDTRVCGCVFASELDGDSNDPLEGVEIRVEGTNLKAVTNAMGNFCLDPAPAGRFFVVIDGKTARNPIPLGTYYPSVGKPFESTAGHETNVGEIYLPLVPADTLHPVSDTEATVIQFPAAVAQANPQLEGTQLLVPPGSLFADDGTIGGMVGIAPVPPGRIPGRLPDFLPFPIVFTVQTDGPTNFALPVAVRFPNLPDPKTAELLAPGAKTALWSFNHDIGSWEVAGAMTVTADGRFLESDPGVGIRAPGWHGSAAGNQMKGTGGPCQGECCPEHLLGIPINPCSWSILGLTSEVIVGLACYSVKLFGCMLVDVFLVGAEIDKILTVCPRCVSSFEVDTAVEDPFQQALDIISASEPQLEALRSIVGSASVNGEFSESDLASIDGVIAELNQQVGSDYLSTLIQLQTEMTASLESDPDIVGLSNLNNPIFYMARYGTNILRGRTTADGSYQINIGAAPNGVVLSFFDPITFGFSTSFIPPRASGPSISSLFGEPSGSGTGYAIGAEDSGKTLSVVDYALQAISPLDDYDLDQLPDAAESVIGTLPGVADTDNDGILDGVEVRQGTNPTNGPVATGIIASAPTPGFAFDILAFNDLVLVADSDAGLSVFNVFNGMEPELVAQVDTEGSAQGVSLLGRLGLVADGPGGVVAIELSSVPSPTTLWVAHLGDVQCVQTIAETVIAGNRNGDLFALDSLTGTRLRDTQLGGPVDDIAVLGETLYVLANGRVHVIPFHDGNLIVVSTEPVPGISVEGRRRRIFAEECVLYVTHAFGYDTFDIGTDPLDPAPIAQGATNQFGWRQIVTNGAGVGLAAVGINQNGSGPSDVNLYDTSDPTLTDELLVPFLTPGTAEAVALYNGLAYVADGEAGLQVINYKAYDSGRQPPSVTLSTTPDQPTLEEHSILLVQALVTDDVQVRNVELLVDGSVVSVDGNHPYEFFVRVPSVQNARITVALRASDTGGNRSAIAERLFDITPDSMAPRLAAHFPVDGQFVIPDFGGFKLLFSEGMERSATASAMHVEHSGADALFGNSDDPIVTFEASFSNDDRQVFLAIDPVPLGRLRLSVFGGVATDLVGNPLDFDGDGTPGDSGQIEVQVLE